MPFWPYTNRVGGCRGPIPYIEVLRLGMHGASIPRSPSVFTAFYLGRSTTSLLYILLLIFVSLLGYLRPVADKTVAPRPLLYSHESLCTRLSLTTD
jgi:hypothetical protein